MFEGSLLASDGGQMSKEHDVSRTSAQAHTWKHKGQTIVFAKGILQTWSIWMLKLIGFAKDILQ